MQIISENVEIKYQENLTTEYIENELKQKGINPIRWAIVKFDKETYTINCAYEKQ